MDCLIIAGETKKKKFMRTPAMQETGDVGSIPASGRFPAGGNGNPLQCCCLGNPMDRGAWQVTKSDVTEHNHGPALMILSEEEQKSEP